MNKKTILTSFGLSLILTGCGTPTWGYEKDNGPDQWANLSSDYSTCKNGKQQSPIDIASKSPAVSKQELELNYQKSPFEIEDTGHSIEFLDQTKDNTVTYNGVEYRLQQIHFHNESENTIDGQHFPLEAHFVHVNADGENLVISKMFELGEENQVLKDDFTKIGTKGEFNPKDLLNIDDQYYNYLGSLTTPPCTEGVKWIVYETPQTISKEQLEQFTKYYANNNRDTQKLNDRKIIKSQ